MKRNDFCHPLTRVLLLLALQLCICPATMQLVGAPVDSMRAARIAVNWYEGKSALRLLVPQIAKSILTTYNGHTSFYIFSFTRGGFVIVSVSDATIPILGYSFDSGVQEDITHPAVREWFQMYHEQIDYVISKKIDNAATLPCGGRSRIDSFSFIPREPRNSYHF